MEGGDQLLCPATGQPDAKHHGSKQQAPASRNQGQTPAAPKARRSRLDSLDPTPHQLAGELTTCNWFVIGRR